ncbi:MAG: HlyD family efflux transporter periplasmic adaptor subunit, partial [Verrucomicrobiota bacterium]
ELERRRLRSPINGIITLVTRDVAERVSAETTVVTVVNLSDLDLVVHVPAELSESLEAEKTLPVERVGVISGRNRGEAVVTFVSPVVDASSGTRRVRLRLANEEGNHVAGVKYRVGFPADLSLSAN